MLEAAGVARAGGTDVVIGWVETHGRAETEALAEGLERLPPRAAELRGVRLREFDLDAALARRPALLLLDELAHTNAPGSRHPKRWQDAVELARRGHRRLHDAQRAAPGEPQRPRPAHHRRPGARDRARPPARRGGRRRVRRPSARGAAAAARRGQGLRARPGRARGPQLLPQGQPDRAARAGAAAHGRARGRRGAGLPRATTRSSPPGRWPSACSSASGPTRRATGWSAARGGWPRGCAPSGSSLASRAPASPRSRRPSARRLAAAFALAEQLGAETVTLTGASVADARAALRARAQRQQARGRQARARALARPAPRLARRRDRARQRRRSTCSSSPGEAEAPGAARRARRRRPRGLRGYAWAAAVVAARAPRSRWRMPAASTSRTW